MLSWRLLLHYLKGPHNPDNFLMKTKIAILFLLALFLTTGIYLGGFASFAQSGSRGDSNSNPLDRLYLLDTDSGESTPENDASGVDVATAPAEGSSVNESSTGLVDLTRRSGNPPAVQSRGNVSNTNRSEGDSASGAAGGNEEIGRAHV